MRESRRRCTPGLRAYQRLMEVDARSRPDNQARLRALSVERRDEVTVTCAHVQWNRSAVRPVGRSDAANMKRPAPVIGAGLYLTARLRVTVPGRGGRD